MSIHQYVAICGGREPSHESDVLHGHHSLYLQEHRGRSQIHCCGGVRWRGKKPGMNGMLAMIGIKGGDLLMTKGESGHVSPMRCGKYNVGSWREA